MHNFFPITGLFRFIQVLNIWILGTIKFSGKYRFPLCPSLSQVSLRYVDVVTLVFRQVFMTLVWVKGSMFNFVEILGRRYMMI